MTAPRASWLAAVLLLCGLGTARAAALEIRVLDVGEGQAVLLRQGARAILIDTGHAGRSRQLLADMQRAGAEQLD